MPLENLVGLVGNDVGAGNVDAKRASPQTIFDVAGLVRRHKDARSYYHRINPTIGKHHVLQHGSDALAAGDIASQTDRRPAVANSGSRDANSRPILVDDLLRRFFSGRFVQIDADKVRAFFHQPMHGGLSNAGACADDDDNLPIEFFLRRHSSQLSFFQRPVLDVESLLLIHRFVLVNCFGSAHHFNRAVIKLRRHTRLALVLAPGDHP